MTEYVFNTWYPAAWSRDLSHELAPRRILDRSLVLYRTSTGAIAALDDACPHRFAPLSIGRLKGDNIECGYHGMTFDCTGQCIRIPGQPIIPAGAKVRSYPVAEKMGLAWIWMGDADLADPSKIYELPQYQQPGWSAVEGDALIIKCDYLSLADNLCDPAHVSFVHPTTLGNAASENIPIQSERHGNRLVTWRWIIDAEPIPMFKKFGSFSGNIDRWHYYHFMAPNIAVTDFGGAPTGTGAPEGARDNCIQMFACHFVTPVDAHTSIDYWQFIKNFPTDVATEQAMIDQFRLAFEEDKAMLEIVHGKEIELNNPRPIRLAIDAGTLRMRAMVDELIKMEQSTARTSNASAA
jgi:vanillate O-demethylase monooxygenase subunit